MRWFPLRAVLLLGPCACLLGLGLACAPPGDGDPLGDKDGDTDASDTDLPRTPDPEGARRFDFAADQLFPPSYADVGGTVAVAVEQGDETSILRAVARVDGLAPDETWVSLRFGVMGSHESNLLADFVRQEDGAFAVEFEMQPELFHEWTRGKLHVLAGRIDGAALARTQVMPEGVVWAVTELHSWGIGEERDLFSRAAGRGFFVIDMASGDGNASVRVAYAEPLEVAVRMGDVAEPDPEGVVGPQVDYEEPGRGGLWLAAGLWMSRELRAALVRKQLYWRIFTESWPPASGHGELGGQIEVDGWSDTGL